MSTLRTEYLLFRCMWLHGYYVCFSPCWPFKRFLQGGGEEKITGADIICFCHVGLASALTLCGPVRYKRCMDLPAHML